MPLIGMATAREPTLYVIEITKEREPLANNPYPTGDIDGRRQMADRLRPELGLLAWPEDRLWIERLLP